MTLKEELAALRTLAETASIGKWEHTGGGALVAGFPREYAGIKFKDTIVMVCPVSPDHYGSQQANAEFIEAVSPGNLIELIIRIQAELQGMTSPKVEPEALEES